MPAFTSYRSVRVRSELHRECVVVVDEAIKHIDFSLIDGARTTAQQQTHFANGTSTLDGVVKKSKHQVYPGKELSDAWDFIPAPFTTWDDRPIFTAYAHFFIGIGYAKGIELRWGGDWDSDFRWRDQSFHDLPHMERVHNG